MKTALVAFLLSLSLLARATTYYIDPTGNDASGNGSSSSPWKTLYKACTMVKNSGDIIHVNVGTYSETNTCNLAPGVSIEGDGASSIITSTTLTAEFTPILSLQSDPAVNGNQEISNLKFDGHSLSAAQALWISGRHNVKIYGCVFADFHYMAVYWAGLGGDEGSGAETGTPPTTYVTGSEFYNNTITNCSAYSGGYARGALFIGGQDGMLIHDNNIDQSGRAAGTNGWPLKMWGNGGWTKGLKIYNNILTKNDYSVWDFAIEGNFQYGIEIYGNTITGTIDLNSNWTGSYAYGAYIHNNTIGPATIQSNPVCGITLEFTQQSVLVEKNLIRNASPPFLFTPRSKSVNNVTFQYNICPGVANIGGMYGIARFLGDNGWSLNGFNVYNNVFYGSTTNNPDYGIIMDSEGASYMATNINIINNIVVGFDTHWLDLSSASSTSYLDVENNIIYNCGNSNAPSYSGTPTNYTYANNILGSNPLLTSSTDFHLKTGSPAIGAGKYIGLTSDYEGKTVGNPPDIGAYQYSSSPSVPSPVYQSSAIANATPTLLTLTYDLTLANIIPATAAYIVMVNGTARAVTSVVISGTTVQLTLANPVIYGDVVTVAYSKPSTNPLQTPAGGQAASFTAQPVTNNVSQGNPVSPSYVNSVIDNATPSLLSITYNLTLANIVPATSSFTVMVNNTARNVTSVAISGTKVLLTLANPVVNGDVITVAYTVPGVNPLQSSSGGLAASLTAQPVTNNVNPVYPVYVSSVIANATPSLLTMTYNSTLANIVPDVSSFTVVVNNVARTVTSVSISGTNVLLSLASPVIFGDIVTVAYTKPSTNPLQNSSGGQAASISAQSVTNNVLAANPIYVSSSIENVTPSLLTMTYNLPLAVIVPAPSAFRVRVNNTTRTITSVAISGTKVLLTLASPVVYGDNITVSYTKPSANPLQTSSGGQAASLSAQPVTNNVNPAIPSYISSAIQNATPNLLTMTYSLSLTNIVPASSAFTVTVNSVVVPVTSVSLSGTLVRLTLANQVVYGDIVTVAYTKPATNPLQTSAGAQAASIIAQPVTNNVTTVNPTYVSSAIENSTPTILTMTYNLNLANIVPAVSAFTVRVNNVTVSITSVAISGTKVILTLANPVVNGNVVTVAYTKPATNPLQTSAGGQAASITAQPVANNVNPVNPVNPVYVSSSIENANPALLTMTYSLTLANIVPSGSAFTVNVNNVARTVTAVSVSATTVLLTLSTPVVNGDVITVAYTKPATNPLQTSSGGQAASMTAQAVTNNVNPVSPNNPVYASSVIENATPALLEMTYSLSLANIVPSTTSFRVRVNNVTRSITSVAVSGTEVQLTLSAPVMSGDIVTVSYTKPFRNPLQTPSGGQAASIRSQSVTNNVSPIISVAPSYVSSVIENSTPSLLVMTYDLNLANIVPDTSAFSVMVNSVAVHILSVAIIGTKVQLTLKNPVVYGDIVFVSYTQPAINPIQSLAGTEAASLSSQPVTNNVSFINSPPIIVINYESDNYSGFVGKIDASGTYDINGDSLTFNWIVPANVEVSSTDSSIIQFLAPIVQVNDTIEFILNVSDGHSVQSQTIAINILPYKPELAASKIAKISVSDYYAIYFPNNIIDDNRATIWSADGDGQWVSLELDKPFKIGYFELAFQEGQNRSSYFDIYASKDGSVWDKIFTDVSSCNFASGYQIFEMPEAKTNSVYSFIKLVGQGNSEDSWNAYSEIKIFGKPYLEYAQMNIYPNPANEIVNISILYPTSFSDGGAVVLPSNIRFFDSSGRLVLDKQVAPGISVVQIPINFRSGIYIVQMVSDGLILSANKLIVVN